MKILEYKDIVPQVKNNTFKFYNFYNLDIDPELFYAVQYYNNTNEDVEGIQQKVKSIFLDIEVYILDKSIEFKFDQSLHPISAISFYYDKVFYAYFLNIHNLNIDTNVWESDFKRQLCDINYKYINDDESIKISVFSDELTLIKSAWNKIKEIDPVVLSGWNSHNFDYPYIYRRFLQLLNNDYTQVNSIISKFNFVKFKDGQITIPEYSIADLMYLYMPREDGGRNYGKKQISYSLNYVSDAELNLKKFDYQSKNIDLHQLYEEDPKNYLLYNIIDVVLCVRLDRKLKMIELHNNLRRIMKCSFEKSLIGSSAVFDSFVISNLNKKIRFGITKQNSKYLPIDKLKRLPSLITEGKRGKLLEPTEINPNDYLKSVFKFDGAYVTKPVSKIISSGLTFSLDAASMYPSMMLQNNISFDSYVGRVLPSTTYKLISLLDATLGNTKTIPTDLTKSIFDLVTKYIATSSKVTQKAKSTSELYFIPIYLLDTLYRSNIRLQNILNPRTDQERYLLSFYLVHLLDVINIIHTNNESYNDVIFNYLFDENKFQSYSEIYCIDNANSSKEKILKLNPNTLKEYIQNYIVTIAGTCFLKHDVKLGLFTHMLEGFFAKRKEFQRKMLECEEGSYDYDRYNNSQNSVKILMNSNYGVQGLKGFRFSNSHLAHTITTQGKLTIKLAQYVTDKYLKSRDF